jgi:hypothetical protein
MKLKHNSFKITDEEEVMVIGITSTNLELTVEEALFIDVLIKNF